jgi:hypothetical protein
VIRQKVQNLRQAVAAYYEARDNGGQAAAAAAAKQVHEAWNALPPGVRSRIEQRHPGTTARLSGLKNQAAGAGSPASGSGGTLTEDKSITGPHGGTTDVDKSWTKNGNTVTEKGTVTGPKGQTTTSKGTWTKNGNTLTEDKSITGPHGGTTDIDKSWTRNGKTVSEQGTVTGPKGQTTTSKGTWTRSGSGAPHAGGHRFKDEFDVFGEHGPHGRRR